MGTGARVGAGVDFRAGAGVGVIILDIQEQFSFNSFEHVVCGDFFLFSGVE